MPPEITEMQTRRQRVGLIAGLACQRNQPAGREGTSAEFFDHDADLALADEYRSEHNGPMSNNKRMMRPITIAASSDSVPCANNMFIHFSDSGGDSGQASRLPPRASHPRTCSLRRIIEGETPP